jgi:hypothetical protein
MPGADLVQMLYQSMENAEIRIRRLGIQSLLETLEMAISNSICTNFLHIEPARTSGLRFVVQFGTVIFFPQSLHVRLAARYALEEQ